MLRGDEREVAMEENTMLTVGVVDEAYVAVDTHGAVTPLAPARRLRSGWRPMASR